MGLSRETWVIIWLSLNLIFVQFYWLRAEKKASYLEGRASVYDELSMKEDGKPFDCNQKPCK